MKFYKKKSYKKFKKKFYNTLVYTGKNIWQPCNDRLLSVVNIDARLYSIALHAITTVWRCQEKHVCFFGEY